MEGHHDGDPLLPGHFVQNIEKLQLVADIQIGRGLVKHDDLRLLADGAGQQDPLALAVTDGVKGSVRELLRVHHGQRLVHLPLIRLRQDPEAPGIGIAAHCRHIPACHQFCLKAACEHNRHLFCQFGRGILLQFFQLAGRILLRFFQLCCEPVRFLGPDSRLSQKDLAADRGELARDRLEDRGLAGSVRSHERHDLSSVHADLYSADQGFSFIADSQPAQL